MSSEMPNAKHLKLWNKFTEQFSFLGQTQILPALKSKEAKEVLKFKSLRPKSSKRLRAVSSLFDTIKYSRCSAGENHALLQNDLCQHWTYTSQFYLGNHSLHFLFEVTFGKEAYLEESQKAMDIDNLVVRVFFGNDEAPEDVWISSENDNVVIDVLERARKMVCPSDQIDNKFFLYLLVLIGMPLKFELEGQMQNEIDKGWLQKHFKKLKPEIFERWMDARDEFLSNRS